MPQRQRKTYTSVDVAVIAMADCKPDGSPAFELIRDMGIRGVRLENLVCYLRSLEHEAALILLVDEQVLRAG